MFRRIKIKSDGGILRKIIKKHNERIFLKKGLVHCAYCKKMIFKEDKYCQYCGKPTENGIDAIYCITDKEKAEGRG